MSVSHISGSASPPRAISPNPTTAEAQDVKAVQVALRQGDTQAASQALTALQNDSRRYAQAASAQNGQAAKDYQALQIALRSGDVSSARQAFAKLQRDVVAASKATPVASAPAVSRASSSARGINRLA